MMDLSLDLASLRRAYATGLDPAALIDMIYDRIAAAHDPGIFISLFERDAARKAAGRLGKWVGDRGPLWGIPFAVKDNIDVVGLATTAACPAFSYLPQAHASAVERLVAAGAIPVGKTNLDQFATGLVGLRTPYPVPLNPFDSSIIPGGSSSGSAVAVARGLVSFALGTDTAGSGRVPAALNNIVGLKPSLGLVSTHGVVPACRTLDCVSVFALTVDDAWDILEAIAEPGRTSGPLGALPPELRIGVPDKASRRFGGDVQAEHAFDRAVIDLTRLGAEIQEVDLSPFFEVATLLYEGPWIAERYQAIRSFIEGRSGDMLPVTRSIIGGGARFSAADAFSGLYRLSDLRRQIEPLWRSMDALMVPSMPRPRKVADVAADPLGPNTELGTYTNFVNLLGLCALAVPARFRDDDFPFGITLLAPGGHDRLLASICAPFHSLVETRLGATSQAQPALLQRPSGARQDEIELVVIGAHMAGMALNGELTGLGGRFLRRVTTTRDYRLFALSGGPPRRPGLLRVAERAGVPIEAEVWGLSAEAFGAFVARVPAPLSIGTVRLSDGTRPKGFLVEAEGILGAEDISPHGSWRAYMRDRAA